MSAELIAQRRRLVDEWNAWRQQCKAELKAMGAKEEGKEEEAKEEIEVWIEEVIEQTEEVIE